MHAPRHGFSLLLGDGSQALGLEKLDASPFRPEIGLQSDEDNRRGWAKVKHLGVPLIESAQSGESSERLTLSITFSSDAGQSMAKQTNKRSVSG